MRFTSSLRFKLLLTFLALTIIPLAILGVVSYNQSQKTLRAEVSETLSEISSGQKALIENWLAARMKEVAVLAAMPAIATEEDPAVWATLQQALLEYGYFETLSVGNDQARSTADVGATFAESRKIDLSQREYYQKAIKGERFISDVLVSKATGNLVIMLSAPIERDGKIVGVMFGSLPTTALAQALESAQLGETGEAYLVNKQGLLMTPSRFTDELKKEGLIKEHAELELKADTLAVKEGLAGKTGVAEYTDYRGNQVLGAYAPIAQTGWALIIEQDSREAFAAATELRNINAGLIGGATLLLVVLVWVVISKLAKQIASLAEDAEALAQGDVAVIESSEVGRKLLDRLAKQKDEFGMMGRAFGELVNYLRDMATVADSVARGDLGVRVEPRGPNDMLGHAMVSMRDSIQGVVAETERLTETATAGQLDARGDASKFEGSFRDIVQGLNNTLDAVIGPLNMAAEHIERIAQGNIPNKITDTYQGDFNEIKNNLNQCIDAVNAMIADAKMLTQGAVAGRLDVRADATKHQGDYRAIIQGVNDTLDAVIGPLNVAAEYIERIAEGNIPSKITERYQGDFNEIVNNLNTCIGAINALAAATNMLTATASAGDFSTRADAAKHQGDYRKIVQGINRTLDVVVDKAYWYEQLLDSIPWPISVTDMNMNWTFINRPVEKMLGIKRADVLGKQCDNWNADICNTANCGIARLRKGELQTHFKQLGRNFQVDTAYIENARGERVGHSEVVQDITAQARSAEYTSAEVERLAASLKKVTEGHLVFDHRVAEGDEYTASARAAFTQVSESVRAMVDGLRRVVMQLQEGAANISSSTAEILASSTQMAATTREQASAVSQITSTVEEIKSSAAQVAQRAQSVAETSSRAAQAADQGTAAADETIAGMDEIRQRVEAIAENILALSEQTQQIGEIIDTVTDIADQSNILALNAAIEAAQAGEAGRGFRVVADEVKNLAEQSRRAASQVKVILGDIQRATNLAVMATEQGTKQVDAGNQLVKRTAQTIEQLAEVSKGAAMAALLLVAGVQQLTVGLDQIAIGMGDINQGAQQAAAGAQQSQSAAEDLSGLGDKLKRLVAQYRL